MFCTNRLSLNAKHAAQNSVKVHNINISTEKCLFKFGVFEAL